MQYFAALILPTDDQLKDRTIERSVPMLLETPTEKVHNDLSVQLDSKKVVLEPNNSATQHFELFAGPKRKKRSSRRCRPKACSISAGSPRSAT